MKGRKNNEMGRGAQARSPEKASTVGANLAQLVSVATLAIQASENYIRGGSDASSLFLHLELSDVDRVVGVGLLSDGKEQAKLRHAILRGLAFPFVHLAHPPARRPCPPATIASLKRGPLIFYARLL